MHRRQEWFRCGRDRFFWEQLNRFAALARGIVMLVKNRNHWRATFQQDAR
jgi:hypothetical protein